MTLTAEDSAFLKRLYQNMDPNRPLEPDDPFYEPIYQAARHADPVDLLYRGIDFAEVESRQFFSGFRGAGKTTELKRLKQLLEQQDYIVLYSDALEYINPAEAIDISDLLIVLAGAFSDAVGEFDHDIQATSESYWTRFWNYLNQTQVLLEEVDIKSGAEFKLALKDVPSVREQIRTKMSSRLFELESQVKKFFEDCVTELRKRHPGQKVVFLFDQLEQIRGGFFNENVVISSVERLFRLHLDRLNLPYIHVVYTVPPWIKFIYPIDVVLLPCVRQWENDPERSPRVVGHDCLQRLVHRRFTHDGAAKLFGHEHDVRVRELVALCGGHVRDLLRLLRETVRRARELPVPTIVIQDAIAEVRSSFLPIPVEDAVWLAKVSETRESGLKDRSPDAVATFTRFLDTHFVLYLRNGGEWYDILPLIREEVEKIAKLAQPK